MSSGIEFTPQARRDVREAFAWYEDQRAGLGDRFLSHLDECFAAIEKRPELFEVVYKHYRRAIVRKFPYAVFYRADGNTITIHSVFQSAQNPRKWRRRLG